MMAVSCSLRFERLAPHLAVFPGLPMRKGFGLGAELADAWFELPGVKASSQLAQLAGDAEVVRIQRPQWPGSGHIRY